MIKKDKKIIEDAERESIPIFILIGILQNIEMIIEVN
jgi:hypothetical protein